MYERFPKDAPIVQKYGGTSVGDAGRIKEVAARLGRQHRAGWKKLAVVVSARSGETNRLVELVREVSPKAVEGSAAYDMALAAGEQVSVALLTAALEAEGIPAQPLLAYKLDIRTDSMHAKARIRSIDAAQVHAGWERGAVAVVAGFQGVTDDQALTTLGRGGSDTSAVALAVALEAAFCEINTDVDGVFTADPRLVPAARLIPQLDYETALEMASLGSKVLHPRCVELGAKWRMPLVVRNTFTPDDHRRTWLMPTPLSGQTGEPIEALAVSGVTLDRAVARVTLTGVPRERSAIADVFGRLGELGVNVDVIVHDRVDADGSMRVGFTVATSDVEQAKSAVTKLAAERGYTGLKATVETGLAKVSAVGVGMRSYAGVAGRTFRALAAQDIDIRMISTSEIKISVVVDDKSAEAAMRALHAEFVES
jgi:aspartate kinase